MLSRTTRLLLRDELIGFARSRVMLVLWLLLPGLALLGYFLLPRADGFDRDMPMIYFIGLMLSSLAGTIGAIMLAVDIIHEKSRKVYELLIVRPVDPGAILWAKFVAVFACVTVACAIALALGIGVDLARGVELPPGTLETTVESMATLIGVIALSAAVGVFFGVITRSILVAVILVLYVGQNLAAVPMVPKLVGLPDLLWLAIALSAVLAAAVMLGSIALFRRQDG